MRTPLRGKGRGPRATVSHATSLPAPVGGWNAHDSLAAMKPTDAVVLDNWFPMPSYCEIRGGYESHATGMTGIGKTLMAYNGLSGTNQMFCTTSSGTYNVTSAGAVGASVAARTNGKHQWTMFGDGTTNWLIACNGVDKPLYYDGTTWTAVDGATTPALTGITTTNLIDVIAFKGRLFFIQKQSLSFWYLTAGLAGGALSEFDLSGEAKHGGYLAAMAVWTRDAGDGQDDVAAFITSEGEAIIYQGNNPASASAWSKIGSFFIGRPLGRRCVTQYGGDVVVLTENGAFPLSAALQSATIDYKMALSFQIENAFTIAARNYSTVFGWEARVFPARSALIVNVPVAEDTTHYQYVMNTITKAWCRFTGWQAEDFLVFNGLLYFCNGTATYQAWTGHSDGGTAIEAYGKQAFSYFGAPGIVKHFTLFRPIFAASGDMSFLVDLDIDFQDDNLTGTAVSAPSTGATWDEAVWDGAYWQSDTAITKQWATIFEWQGMSASAKVKISSSTLLVQWVSSDFIWEPGGML